MRNCATELRAFQREVRELQSVDHENDDGYEIVYRCMLKGVQHCLANLQLLEELLPPEHGDADDSRQTPKESAKRDYLNGELNAAENELGDALDEIDYEAADPGVLVRALLLVRDAVRVLKGEPAPAERGAERDPYDEQSSRPASSKPTDRELSSNRLSGGEPYDDASLILERIGNLARHLNEKIVKDEAIADTFPHLLCMEIADMEIALRRLSPCAGECTPADVDRYTPADASSSSASMRAAVMLEDELADHVCNIHRLLEENDFAATVDEEAVLMARELEVKIGELVTDANRHDGQSGDGQRAECIRLQGERVVKAYNELKANPDFASPDGNGIALFGDLLMQCRLLGGWLETAADDEAELVDRSTPADDDVADAIREIEYHTWTVERREDGDEDFYDVSMTMTAKGLTGFGQELRVVEREFAREGGAS